MPVFKSYKLFGWLQTLGTVQRYNMGYVSQKRQLKKKKFKKIKGSEQLQRQEGTLPFCGSTVKYFKHEDFSRQFNLKLRQDSPYTNHSLVCIKKKNGLDRGKIKLCVKNKHSLTYTCLWEQTGNLRSRTLEMPYWIRPMVHPTQYFVSSSGNSRCYSLKAREPAHSLLSIPSPLS